MTSFRLMFFKYFFIKSSNSFFNRYIGNEAVVQSFVERVGSVVEVIYVTSLISFS